MKVEVPTTFRSSVKSSVIVAKPIVATPVFDPSISANLVNKVSEVTDCAIDILVPDISPTTSRLEPINTSPWKVDRPDTDRSRILDLKIVEVPTTSSVILAKPIVDTPTTSS